MTPWDLITQRVQSAAAADFVIALYNPKSKRRVTQLDEVQKIILQKKISHEKNSDIAGYVNREFGKSYTANYISTIFRQKIIPKINEAASFHLETVSNYFWPENFKNCSSCGRALLLHENNWVRKARSKDGFQNRCKRCEKKLREEKRK